MVMGHHAHVPKAIEMYKGKAIFYSLSNFCMTKPFPSPKWKEEPVEARCAAQPRRPESRHALPAVRARREALVTREGGLSPGPA
jgi:hypothetical protein